MCSVSEWFSVSWRITAAVCCWVFRGSMEVIGQKALGRIHLHTSMFQTQFNCIKLVIYFIIKTKIQGTTNQIFQMPNRHKELYTLWNTKRRIYKTNAAIWFNKICRERQLTPGYISIKINGNKQQDKNTLRMAIHHRLGQEIKFLHLKKTRLNQQLYTLHLECAKIWNSYWQPIYDTINNNLHKKWNPTMND